MTAPTGGTGGRAVAFGTAALLAVAAVVTLLAPPLGVVGAADGSAVWFAPGALWVVVVPALLVAAVAIRRPMVALAVAAGSGLVGLARLLADLPVVTSPDSLARPDLFVETTDRSLPLHAATGASLLLAADALMLVAGVVAAMRLARGLPPVAIIGTAAGIDRVAGNTAGTVTGTAGGAAGGAAPDAAPDPDEGPSDGAVESGTGPRRNYLLTGAGFLGALLLAVGGLGVPYQGGYLAGRYLAVGVPLAGIVAAVVLAVLAATAVLVGGSLPRGLAMGLLGGVALGASLPYLTALVAVSSAPVRLSPVVWVGLVGAALLAAAGLLVRRRPGPADPATDPDPDTNTDTDIDTDGPGDAAGGTARAGVGPTGDPADLSTPSRATGVAAGACGLGAAALCVAALLLPQIDAGGLEDLVVLSDGSALPAATLFGAAVVPLAVAAILSLIGPTARAGRAALMVVWAAAVPAVTAALQVLGDDTVSTERMLGLVHIGSGTWCGVAGLALAVAAAVLAALASRRAADTSDAVVDDDSLVAARGVTVPVAVALGVVTVVAALLPVYGTSGLVQGPSLLHGYDVSAWGVWAAVVGSLGALVGAAMSRHRDVAVALVVAAAAVQAVRLVIPAGVGGDAGFGLRAGMVVEAVAVAVLLAGCVVIARAVGRVGEVAIAAPVAAATPAGASSRQSRRRKR